MSRGLTAKITRRFTIAPSAVRCKRVLGSTPSPSEKALTKQIPGTVDLII